MACFHERRLLWFCLPKFSKLTTVIRKVVYTELSELIESRQDTTNALRFSRWESNVT